MVVEWQTDPQRKETWTEVYAGNVVDVLDRLRIMEGYADYVVFLY